MEVLQVIAILAREHGWRVNADWLRRREAAHRFCEAESDLRLPRSPLWGRRRMRLDRKECAG